MARVSSTRIVKLTDPQDPLTVEKIVDTVDFNGRVSTTTYDLLQRLVTYTSPGGRQRILSLDEKGRVTKSEIPGLEPVHFNYGKRGELLSVRQGEQTILSYSYDEFCRLSGMRNSEGNQINYVCDESGRILESTLPSGKVNKFTYDANGNLTEITVPSGAVHQLNYARTYEYLYGNPEKPFQVTAIREPSGVLSVCYYDDLGLLFAMQRDEDWFYVATDQLGTPIVVVDATGETVKVLEYESFGNEIADSNPYFVFPIGFAAGLVDWDTNTNFWYVDFPRLAPTSFRFSRRIICL